MPDQCPIIPAPNEKDLERQARYRLSQDFVQLLEQVEIGLYGRRLALGLAHAICRETSDWHDGAAVQPGQGYRVRCKELRTRLGLDGTKGNRELERGLNELMRVRLLEGAAITCGRQWLDWRLNKHAFSRFFEPEPYGLFDIRHARRLTTPLDYLVYNRIGLIRRCRTPMVTLSVEGCAVAADRSPEWSRLRLAMLEALRKAAELFDLKLLAICEGRGLRPGIDHVTLRLLHAQTNWSTAGLGKLPTTARKLLAVDESGSREVKPV